MRRLILIACAVALLPSYCLAGQQEEKKGEEKKPFKRRDDSSDETLRKQLQFVPELGFDQVGAAFLLNTMKQGAKVKIVPLADFGPKMYSSLAQKYNRLDQIALPWRLGAECQTGKETAEGLQVFSVALRDAMRKSTTPSDLRPNPAKVQELLAGGRAGKARVESAGALAWEKTESLPTLMQMLQVENTAMRLLLVEYLGRIKGKEASLALAQRAMFDLSPEVREKAVEALAERPVKEYQQLLMNGLRWPWQAAVDHAAEAIVALKLKDAVPELVELLKLPDPRLPYTNPDKVTYVRELVKLNHMSNCLLCHAPSMSKDDLVRGRIPVPGEDPPPLYYAERTGNFVRADITYLRQDFSVVQPVENAGKWPGFQRFDYMLRERKATQKEEKFLQGMQEDGKLQNPFPQRETVLFALRELTGKDLGSRTEAWLPLQNPIQKKDAK